MLCDLVSLKDLDIRGKEVGICIKEVFFMTELNGIVLEEVIHVHIHGWESYTERQKVSGNTNWTPSQVFKSHCIIINVTFPIISCDS